MKTEDSKDEITLPKANFDSLIKENTRILRLARRIHEVHKKCLADIEDLLNAREGD